ncbi:cytochrome P450 [Podospora fimiseda]|uniref:Cytochrome P450 n=1 Tax=Podospora fimiseda TaxID=252190 RepID=A0AAN7GXG7_9PEZI|nr:cytochrome P450 [Podospora fimiseda]
MMDVQFTLVLSLVEALGLTIFQQHNYGSINLSSMVSYQTITTYILSYILHLFVAQYVTIKLYRIFIWPRLFSPLRHIPGPKTPFYSPLGSMPAILSGDSPIDTYVTWAKMWPTTPFIRFLSIFNTETLIAVTPEATKEVFTTHCYDFKKPAIVANYMSHILGTRGVLFIEGDAHKAARKRLNPLFAGTNVKRMLPLFQQKAREMTNWFTSKLDSNGTQTIDVANVYNMMTIDIIGIAVFGIELENLSSTDNQQKKWDFLSCYKMLFEQSTLSAILTFINAAVPIRWIPLKANRDFTGASRQVRKMTTEVVRNRMREVNEKTQFGTVSGGNDLLTMMIEDVWKFRQGEGLDEEYIVDEMLTFLLAGHETSANALLWATYAMAVKPDVQDKLRAEIATLFEKDEHKVPTMGEIESLPYLNCFLKEVLRLYSPALFGYREAINDLYLCGEFIPKGTTIMYSPHVTCSSEAIWGPTAGQFIPERWEKSEGPATDPYSTNNFINGPRVCVGKQFALVEIKTLLVEIVPRFRLGMSPQLKALGGKLPKMMNPGVTYRPADALYVTFERI